MLPGRITLQATALALTCVVGAAPAPGSNILSAFATARSVGQDGHEAGAKNSPHRYKRSSRWIACGAIEYPGYDGCIGAEGNGLLPNAFRNRCEEVIVYSMRSGYETT